MTTITKLRTSQEDLIAPYLMAVSNLGGDKHQVQSKDIFAEVRKNIESSLTEKDKEVLPCGVRRVDQVMRNLVSNRIIQQYVSVHNRKVKMKGAGVEEVSKLISVKSASQSQARTLQKDVVDAALIAANRLYNVSHRNVIKCSDLFKETMSILEPKLTAADKAPLPSSPNRRRIDQVVTNTLTSNRVMDKLGYTTFNNINRTFVVDRRKVTAAVKALAA